MIYRIGYALWMSWRHRKALGEYCFHSNAQVENVLALDLALLKQEGTRVMILDFDGVLASHGEEMLDIKIQDWLRECLEIFGEGKVFILSNRPSFKRWNYFTQHFRGIKFLSPKRKKPYPDGLLEILNLTQQEPKTLLLVDDRLLTGILASVIANIQARYVVKPWIALKKRPIQELFFMSLRQIDRWLIWLYQKGG